MCVILRRCFDWFSSFMFRLMSCGEVKRKLIDRYTTPDDYRSLIEGWLYDPLLSNLVLGYYKRAYSQEGDALVMQCLDEMTQLHKELNGRNFSNYVELGSFSGSSLWIYPKLFCSTAAKIVCIDPVTRKDLGRIVDALKESGSDIHYLQKTAEESVAEIPKILGSKIECLFIDADHSIGPCREYWNLYAPLVAEGGVVILHDTYLWPGPFFLRKFLEKNADCKTIRGKLLLSQVPMDSCGITIVFNKKGKLPYYPLSPRIAIFDFLEKATNLIPRLGGQLFRIARRGAG